MPVDNTLLLRHCTANDLPALAAILDTAFTGPRLKVMYRNVTPSDRTKYLEDVLRREFSYPKDTPHPQSVHFVCVVDTTSNEIISFVIWNHLPKGYLASEDFELQRSSWPAGSNVQLGKDFYRMTGELRSMHPGRKDPHWLLCSLATLPNHEGRGAGSMLIKWAFPKADEMGIRCYVDASWRGLPVYKKRGFGEECGVMDLFLSRYEGGEGYELLRYVALLREPEKMKS